MAKIFSHRTKALRTTAGAVVFILNILGTGGTAVFAQPTSVPVESDIPPALVSLAQELGCATRAACEAAFENNPAQGIELAEKHNVYGEEERQLARTFRQEVLSQLSTVGENEFDEKIVELAKQILRSKPALARQLGVNQASVRAAETVVTEIKNAGTDLRVCSRPAESLSREELVKCLDASRRLSEQADVVSPYVSKEKLESAIDIEGTVKLEEALARGEYRELGGTADEIGATCLRPGSESLIVCDEIAAKFFGSKGTLYLKQARQQVESIEAYYKQDAERFVLTTSDGQKIAGKDAIRASCDEAFTSRNIERARACGEFAVKNGLASREDIEEGLQFMESFKDTPADFSACRENPAACEQYIPTSARGEFTVMRQIEEIMRAEIGFSPDRCSEGNTNPEIGQRCFEGAKSALPKIEALAQSSPQAQRIAAEIRGHVEEGERYQSRKDEAETVFRTGGGPGGCRSAEECYRYCSDPIHGPECLAFGAKQGLIKEGEATGRFEEYSRRLQGGPYPKFQPTGTDGTPPGQYPGFTQPGPGFTSPQGTAYFPGNPSGPNPECFRAIQDGDFVKAKEICRVPTSVYDQPQSPPDSRQFTTTDVQAGSDRERMIADCVRGGQSQEGCVQRVEEYLRTRTQPPQSQPQPGVCPALPTVDSCLSGERREVSFSSRECGTYYRCVSGGPTPVEQCPAGQYWYVPAVGGVGYCRQSSDVAPCPTGQYWNGTACIAPVTPPPGGCPSGQYWDGVGCRSDQGQACPTGQYWNGSRCVSSGPGTTPCPSGQYWNGNACVASGDGASGIQKCFYPNASRNGQPVGYTVWCEADYNNCHEGSPSGPSVSLAGLSLGAPSSCESGRPSQNCPSGQYWNGTACANSGSGSCSSGQYWYVPPGGGSGYCTSSGGTGGGSQTCDSALTALLGAGCHYMYNDSTGNSVFCNSEMTRSAKRGDANTQSGCEGSGTGGTPSSGQREQVWNSLGLKSWIRSDADSSRIEQLKTACVNVPQNSNVWTAQAGNSTSPDFGMPDSEKCRLATTCSSGQYFNGSACVDSSSGNSCPSGQYWNGTSCVSQPSSSCGSYTSQTSCVSASTACDWNTSGSNGWCQASSGGAVCGNYICQSGEATSCPADCSYTSPGTNCPSGQYWNGTACANSGSGSCSSGQYWYVPPGGGSGYCTSSGGTGTGSGSCEQYGSGWHTMDSSGNCFNPAMSEYKTPAGTLNSCSSAYVPGCSGSGSGSTSCSSGQYWNGSSCVPSSSTACPSGQYWNGSACVNTSPTECPSGQYWSGTACVSSASSGGSSCTSGQYWDGTACVSSGGNSSCPSNQYWNGSACVSNSSTGSTSCPSDQYWSGSACVTNTPTGGSTDPSVSCSQAGGTWNGTSCQMPSGSLSAAPSLANILTQFTSLLEALLRALR